MRYSIAELIRGTFTMCSIVVGTIVICVPFFLVALLKIVPSDAWRLRVGSWLAAIAEAWISFNGFILDITQRIDWGVSGSGDLKRDDWYLLICNHQSWVDILVLQRIFNRRVPFLKFFIKRQLAWMPFLGQAWWALDMPFMRRHSREYLERHPGKRAQDLDATRRACEKFRRIPTTLVNFVEGTRFKQHKRQDHPDGYRHLLPPRAGGIGYALSAMQGILRNLLDVTIAYPDGPPSFWQLCCGRVHEIAVSYRSEPLMGWLLSGDYSADEAFKQRLQAWLRERWEAKDRLLAGEMGASSA